MDNLITRVITYPYYTSTKRYQEPMKIEVVVPVGIEFVEASDHKEAEKKLAREGWDAVQAIVDELNNRPALRLASVVGTDETNSHGTPNLHQNTHPAEHEKPACADPPHSGELPMMSDKQYNLIDWLCRADYRVAEVELAVEKRVGKKVSHFTVKEASGLIEELIAKAEELGIDTHKRKN